MTSTSTSTRTSRPTNSDQQTYQQTHQQRDQLRGRDSFTKRASLLFTLFVFALALAAQAPTGYYTAAKGKKAAALKTALYGIVADHTARSYKQLWEDFKTTDVRSDGKIWDMYSNTTNYTPGGSAQGGNYSAEGDSYNREHSFPKSWFNDATPMYTDLFHLYPTDGYVNNRRSNYPFGETEGETYKSNGGFSKVGKCTVSGYSGTVFEPADEYKGDFARSYFYMATAYEDKIASWSSDMLAGNKYPAYASWALQMLLRWAEEDPVSEKEIARNNAVYKIQGNRNPYIDFPGLEQYVWGSMTSTAFDPTNYTEPGTSPDPTPTTVSAPVFSPASGTVKAGTTVSITTETEGAYIYYSVNSGAATAEGGYADSDTLVAYPPVSLTITESTTIAAYAMLGEARSETVTATYTLQGETPDQPVGENVYTLVTADEELTAGTQLLIVCEGKGVALAAQGDDIRSYAEVTIARGGGIETATPTITTEVNASGKPYALLLGGASGAWTLLDQVDNVYLSHTASKNKLNTSDTADDDTALWTISISSDGTATITNKAHTSYVIQYNASSPRFACYKSTQQPVSIFALSTVSAIDRIAHSADGTVSVYTLSGRLVRKASTAAEALRGLEHGVYVVGGKKAVIK